MEPNPSDHSHQSEQRQGMYTLLDTTIPWVVPFPMKESPLKCKESQTELYYGYIEVSLFILSNGFHGAFAYIGKQDRHQMKY